MAVIAFLLLLLQQAAVVVVAGILHLVQAVVQVVVVHLLAMEQCQRLVALLLHQDKVTLVALFLYTLTHIVPQAAVAQAQLEQMVIQELVTVEMDYQVL
jgi:hypothetical protein